MGEFEGVDSGGGSYFDAGVVAPPSGLASLDVEIPLRGTPYRFTIITPGRPVEISARTASLALINGLARLGGVLAAVVIVLLVGRALRRRSFSLQARSGLATALIVLGILGLLFGMLPVAGLLALVVGVVMKVRVYFARRRPAKGAAGA